MKERVAARSAGGCAPARALHAEALRTQRADFEAHCKGGRVHEAIRSRLAEAYATGNMPMLLPPAGGAS